MEGISPDIGGLISAIRIFVPEDCKALFEIYAEEASFARKLIEKNLADLPFGANILEVGAGMLLLSCQLQREGYHVTAIEPIDPAFNHFHTLQKVVLEYATKHRFFPRLISEKAEHFLIHELMDFSFSVNVMEHVVDVGAVLKNVLASLRPGASYRFICPNYFFPYEPHFNILTLGSKALTLRFMGGGINNSNMPNSREIWDSLNWITVKTVRLISGNLNCTLTVFSSEATLLMLDRLIRDEHFRHRRSGCFLALARMLFRSSWCNRMILSLFPVTLLPVIDCSIMNGHQTGLHPDSAVPPAESIL